MVSEKINMIVFLGNSGNINGAPTAIAVFYAIAMIICAALTWTFVWFCLMPFGITSMNWPDWIVKGLMFYFLLFGIPILLAIRDDKKKNK